MLSRRLIASMPLHSSHIEAITRLHACCLAGSLGWFCNVVCLPLQIYVKADFKRTEWHADIAIGQQGCQSGTVVTVVMSILGCSSLSRTSAELDLGWPRKTVTAAFEVVCGWSVAGIVIYDVITMCCCQSVCWWLVVDFPQLDQLTWCASRHLTRRLCADTVGALRWGDVDNFCIWIIRNCCPNYWEKK